MLRTSIDRLKEILISLGVADGDTVMVHSALFTFGRIENDIEGFHSALRDLVGPQGTLVVPTFTYSFRRGQIFDVANTPAPKELGGFAEYLRRRPSAVRSPDPLFSMAAEGPRAEALMRRNSTQCFGSESVFANLFGADILILALGITFSTGLASFMHLEKLARVDYRRDMEFSGTSIGLDGGTYADVAIHHARDEARYPRGRTDREALGRAMEDRGIAAALDYGSGHHVGLRATAFQEFVIEVLACDPHAMFLPDGNGTKTLEVT